MPIFLSTPVSDPELTPPFKFIGGLGLSTKTLGLMLAVQGVYSLVAQLWLFPLIVRHLGTLSAYRLVQLVWPLLYLAVPYLVLLPTSLQMPAAYISLILKMTFHVISFPSNAMLLANSAPSTTVLGSINGVAASTASLSRALGPTVTGYLYSNGLKWGYVGLAWWACGIVCAVGATESFWVKDEDNKNDGGYEKSPVDDADDADCEADADGSYVTHCMVSPNECMEDLVPSPSQSPSPSSASQLPVYRLTHSSSPQETIEAIPDLELPSYGGDYLDSFYGISHQTPYYWGDDYPDSSYDIPHQTSYFS